MLERRKLKLLHTVSFIYFSMRKALDLIFCVKNKITNCGSLCEAFILYI